MQGGLERSRCDLSGLDTRDEYVAHVAGYATAHPEREWILGGGWAMAAFPGGTPTAADLDAVAPGRPVFLAHRDHHGAWVSSRALELAGIDRHTPDPADGRIERDADGRLTGTLHRAGARLVMGSDWPVTTPDPLAALHTAVTRTTYGEDGRAGTEAFLPEQALDLTTAFVAYTSGSAWLNHRDVGRRRAGRLTWLRRPLGN